MTRHRANGSQGAGPGPVAGDDAWPAWYARFVVAGLALAILFGAGGFATSNPDAALAERLLAYVVIPMTIALSLYAAIRGRPTFLLLVMALLDVEALMAAARFAIGLAYAVLFPLIGLVLIVGAIRGRALAAGFSVTALTMLAGIAVALTIGPIAQAQPLDPWLAVAASGLFIVFALTHLWLLNERRARALEAARSEVASRRVAEAELEQTSRLLSAIVDASPVATQAFTADRRVILWNRASERLFGWSSDEVIGTRMPLEMTPEADRVSSAERIARTLEGEIIRGERVHRRSRDGRDLLIDIYAAPLIAPDGTTLGIAGQLVDVTDRVALEAQLRQAAKMEAIGRLAGGVAHDFNNMLTAIRGYADMVRRGLPPDRERDRDDLDQIVLAADRAAELTRQLLAFARQTVLTPRVIEPATIVAGFAPMLRRLLGEDIDLVLGLSPETGRVRADPVQLEQVILNLAVNARDAMEAGGSLRIETSNAEVDEGFVATHPAARSGPHVLLAVSDTGVGMDDATLGRIFDPFFTTKETGTGTGMGLATVFGIVTMSGGTIDVSSRPGQGTTFRIWFPRLVEGAAADAPDPLDTATPEGHETILVVEDDPAIRAYARRSLADLGYAVLEAPGGKEALALAAGHLGTIDLLLSDVVLPGIQGPDLARRLRDLRPDLRTVFCSGSGQGISTAAASGPGDAFLGKPYTRESLGRAVREALDRAG